MDQQQGPTASGAEARINGDQAEYWNGEVGQRWAASQGALDALFAPLTDGLFAKAALRPGETVLDVGCGSGETTLHAARQVGTAGRVVEADLSAPLLAVGRERARHASPDSAPVEWREADAQTEDFGAGAFDAALSRFGFMFFENSQAAFANLHRALKPGGRLTLMCWRGVEENGWVSVPREIVLRFVPGLEPTPPEAPGPFRFARRESLVPLLEAAGFRAITCDRLDQNILLGGSPATAAEVAVDLGPTARLLREREASVREAAR